MPFEKVYILLKHNQVYQLHSRSEKSNKQKNLINKNMNTR